MVLLLVLLSIFVIITLVLVAMLFSTSYYILGSEFQIISFLVIAAGVILIILIVMLYNKLIRKKMSLFISMNPKDAIVNNVADESLKNLPENEAILTAVARYLQTPTDLSFLQQQSQNNEGENSKREDIVAINVKNDDNEVNIHLYNRISEKIKNLLNVEKIYLDKNLSIGKFAEAVGEPVKDVSHVIKHDYHIGFVQLINQYRIKHVIHLLTEKEYDKFKIDYIGWLSGFQSRSSFYQAFTNYMGQSPAAYRELQQANKDSITDKKEETASEDSHLAS